jgi:hypothetical protein
MLRGETTTRSALDPDAVVQRPQARGIAHLREEAAIWVSLDGSHLRTPHAQCMEALPRVKRLHGEGAVPGDCTRCGPGGMAPGTTSGCGWWRCGWRTWRRSHGGS